MEAVDAALERMTERMATADAQLQDVVKLTYFVTDVTLDQLTLGLLESERVRGRAMQRDHLVPLSPQLRCQVGPQQPRPPSQVDAHGVYEPLAASPGSQERLRDVEQVVGSAWVLEIFCQLARHLRCVHVDDMTVVARGLGVPFELGAGLRRSLEAEQVVWIRFEDLLRGRECVIECAGGA